MWRRVRRCRRKGGVGVIDWVLQGERPPAAAFRGAVARGRVSTLCWLEAHGCRPQKRKARLRASLSELVRGEDLSTLQWLSQHGFISPLDAAIHIKKDDFYGCYKKAIVEGFKWAMMHGFDPRLRVTTCGTKRQQRSFLDDKKGFSVCDIGGELGCCQTFLTSLWSKNTE